MKKTVGLDFDGVCNLYSGWKGEDELFAPRPGLRAFLEKLQARGYNTVIHSSRSAEKIAVWLVENGLEELVDQVTDRKPPSMVNLDDRGVCFKGDFDAALAEIESFRPFWQVPEPEPCEKHNCTGHTFYDSYFPSIIFCKETDDGHFIAGSPACESEVAFCPYCGKQAPKPPRPPREYDE